MARRFGLTVVLLALVCTALNAGDGKPTFVYGAEWGYGAKILESHKFTFYDEYGSIVSDNSTGLAISGNGYFLLDAGLYFGKKSKICIQSGYMGISEKRQVIPVLMKYTFLPGGHCSDGALMFASGGIGIPLDQTFNSIAAMASIGSGYRFYLGNRICVDLSGSIRLSFDHPGITDSGRAVSPARTRRNNAMYGAICFGIGLNF